MKEKDCARLKQAVAMVLAVVLTTPLVQAMPELPGQQDAAAQQQTSPAQPAGDQQNTQPSAPALETRPQQTSPPTADQMQQNSGAKPLGTAAAPLTKPTGIAASRPAGAAIAPAKQRRVRKIVIRVGIVVAAAAAVGAVAGLSQSSSGRP